MPPALFSPTFMVRACCSINLPTSHVCKMFMFLNPLLLRGFATISTYEIDFFTMSVRVKIEKKNSSTLSANQSTVC